MKTCPFCAEDIQDAAIVCRFCNRDLPGAPKAARSAPAEPEWTGEAKALLFGGNKIKAIKLTREHTGLGLKEAKDLVESWALPPGVSRPSRRGLGFGQLLGYGVLAFFALGIIGSFLPKSPTTAPAATAPALETMTADALFDAYSANSVAADQRYKGKTVRLSGSIRDIGKDILGSPYITFDIATSSLGSVQAIFRSADNVTGLSKSQRVTLVCSVDGKLMNVIVRKCSF